MALDEGSPLFSRKDAPLRDCESPRAKGRDEWEEESSSDVPTASSPKSFPFAAMLIVVFLLGSPMLSIYMRAGAGRTAEDQARGAATLRGVSSEETAAVAARDTSEEEAAMAQINVLNWGIDGLDESRPECVGLQCLWSCALFQQSTCANPCPSEERTRFWTRCEATFSSDMRRAQQNVDSTAAAWAAADSAAKATAAAAYAATPSGATNAWTAADAYASASAAAVANAGIAPTVTAAATGDAATADAAAAVAAAAVAVSPSGGAIFEGPAEWRTTQVLEGTMLQETVEAGGRRAGDASHLEAQLDSFPQEELTAELWLKVGTWRCCCRS